MKKALNLTILTGRGISQREAAELIARAGFEGCFYVAEQAMPLEEVMPAVKNAGLFMEFLHAPVKNVDKLWYEGDAGEEKLRELLFWVRQCSRFGISAMVSHVWTKYEPMEPNALGADRFRLLLDEAQREGVRIAFENAEVPKFMTYVKKTLWDHPAAFFCFDTGHELCYTDGADQVAQFGDKLLLTHLNDNLGRTGTMVTSADDAHMMPFDGKVDWENVARRIAGKGYTGNLTFELKMRNKPGRHTHDRYLSLSDREILELALRKAIKFEELLLSFGKTS